MPDNSVVQLHRNKIPPRARFSSLRSPGNLLSTMFSSMTLASSEEKYSPLPDCEDTRGLISENDCIRHGAAQRHVFERLPVVFAGVIVLGACLSSLLAGVLLGRRYPSNDGAIRHVSKFSKWSSHKSGLHRSTL